MKTWRERIAEARERNTFTQEDTAAWVSAKTCMVGEQRERYGIGFPLCMGLPLDAVPAAYLGRLLPPENNTLQFRILTAIHRNDFDAAESLLDAIEDRALELKRESTNREEARRGLAA